MKKLKPTKASHTSSSKTGMGDHYGSGIRNPVGKPIDVMGMKNFAPKKLGKPPKSLA